MSDVSRVLFVCVENSNRSQIAEAFARLLGGDGIESYSAGSKPSGKVTPKAVAAMQSFGYDLTTHRSKSLDELPADARATSALVPGEILRAGRVIGSAASALAALLPHDHLAFRVAADGLGASPDDTVRLFDLATGRVVVVAARVLIRDDATASQKAMLRCLSDVLARVPADWSVDPIGPDAEAELLNWDAEKYRQALAART